MGRRQIVAVDAPFNLDDAASKPAVAADRPRTFQISGGDRTPLSPGAPTARAACGDTAPGGMPFRAKAPTSQRCSGDWKTTIR